MEAFLSFDQVGKTFEHRTARVQALQAVSFAQFQGEIVSVIGPSGCGKSTLLRLACGSIMPTEGVIKYRNKPIDWARRRGLFGFVPQSLALLPNRTVLGNIMLPLEVKRIMLPKEEVCNLIRKVGLAGCEEMYPTQLSGGMRQRVSLARALVHHPEFLLMDEPFASIDELLREKLNEELVRICRSIQQSILIVTHDIEEAVFLGDRVLILSDQPGTIVGDVPVRLAASRNASIRSSDAFFETVKEIRSILKEIKTI